MNDPVPYLATPLPDGMVRISTFYDEEDNPVFYRHGNQHIPKRGLSYGEKLVPARLLDEMEAVEVRLRELRQSIARY